MPQFFTKQMDVKPKKPKKLTSKHKNCALVGDLSLMGNESSMSNQLSSPGRCVEVKIPGGYIVQDSIVEDEIHSGGVRVDNLPH